MGKPKVFIAGLQAKQASMIQQEFGGQYDLRFWKDESSSSLKSGASSCDVGILFGSKSSHNAAEVMRAKCPQCHVVMGGLTTLRAKLADLQPMKEVVA